MLMLLSPAKDLNFERPVPLGEYSLPRMLEKSALLLATLKKLSLSELGALMELSEKLALLNWQRFQDFTLPYSNGLAKPALYAFNGDAYQGLEGWSLPPEVTARAQRDLAILSGLYGLLRPLDLILPYRLEMGRALKTEGAKNLYQFWRTSLSERLAQDIEENGHKTLVNLASIEYFKVVEPKQIKVPILNPQFKEFKDGQYKMVSFFAKRARGLMCRYLLTNRVDQTSGILEFDLEGYQYQPKLSGPLAPVFTRGGL
ncbi:MAG: hypothetical protein A2508_08940 [Candidatus Lambdaproteobacteria bacterium RIFOXYD12_FULL_49_8]|uniref:UPF0246 protein A2527_04790 n=1 Tax=Candidatus Lambdaproteobacteria bacterium RIFOXYD2_FULL_50_16 TaxID=1817772 RepID=A0A1F6GBD3_9PROT|nr:MAG: hypothetical protein A2527_04790 [Candidatus Lambdaproteobacteria bacterium RIFOXYD2_FULL_50_16]OGG97674.1 MAG: hypothetical protein A2508_08940 [Candidatus Lambdaproteobacteria bacterium RIFOXYD12_FULL_49_8]